jgi:ketosteroid isomerase-like protein
MVSGGLSGDTGRAMSEEEVESVRRGNDAINRGDKAAWLDTVDPSVVMIPAREWPENAPLRGADALWDYYTRVTDAWEGGAFELGEAIDSGNRVVVNVSSRGTRQGERCSFRVQLLVVGTFRDGGRSLRVEWFSNREEAVDAARLSE